MLTTTASIFTDFLTLQKYQIITGYCVRPSPEMQNMITLHCPGVNINTLYCCWNAEHAPASQDKDISDNYPWAAPPGHIHTPPCYHCTVKHHTDIDIVRTMSSLSAQWPVCPHRVPIMTAEKENLI